MFIQSAQYTIFLIAGNTLPCLVCNITSTFIYGYNAVLNNKKISLADVLRDFDRGLLGKTAEELEAPEEAAPAYGLQPTEPVPVVADEAPEDEYEDDYEDEEEGNGHDDECECDVCQMHEALDELEDKQEEAVDAARVLRDMADDYIDKHDEEIAKEASLFGELFAKSACEYMNRNAYFGKTAEQEYEESYYMVKQAVDAAYEFTLRKLASDEAFVAAAQAVSDSAAAAKALVENMGGDSGADPEAEAGRAAAEAYNETMAQMGAGEQAPSPEEQQQAAQGGYDEAMAQMQQAQPQPQPAEMAGASQNAYDQAMGQIADQQQMQQGY